MVGPAIIGFAAASGTGKTTLLRKVIPLLLARGLRIGVVKQARDDFDVDIPGKDSYELRKAGVARLLLTSEDCSALVDEHPQGRRPCLETLFQHSASEELDLVLVEGFSSLPLPRILLHRADSGTPPPDLLDPEVLALVGDRNDYGPLAVPVLDINDPAAVAGFLLRRLTVHRLENDLE